MIGPVLDEIEKEHTEIKIAKIDVDSDGALAEKYKVVSIPHLVLIKNGKEVDSTVGYHTKEELLDFVK